MDQSAFIGKQPGMRHTFPDAPMPVPVTRRLREMPGANAAPGVGTGRLGIPTTAKRMQGMRPDM